MAEIKKKKPDQEPMPPDREPLLPAQNGHIPRPKASSVPGYGGSRQGNIGHEGNDVNDSAHR